MLFPNYHNFISFSLPDLSSRRVPTFHLPGIYFIFLGTRHCITFWTPGPLRPGGLSRSPSTDLAAETLTRLDRRTRL